MGEAPALTGRRPATEALRGPTVSADTGRVPDPDQLLDEWETIGFEGWDFTSLGTRLVLEPPPWAFEESVAVLAARSGTMLDMGTGVGEWLSSLARRGSLTVATESWPPNVGVAAARLRVLGIPVVQAEGAADNHRQDREDPKGRLPFRTEAFDLVTNRHESFVASEVSSPAENDH
jgi:2-polyprenyl-3-methyl-5-hydroxy-6-metoxy-1,4-benzoquinol methylase